jgi:hypothetical protein
MFPPRPLNHRGGSASVAPFNPRQKHEQKTLREEINDRESNGSQPMWITSMIRELGEGLEVNFLYIVIEDSIGYCYKIN